MASETHTLQHFYYGQPVQNGKPSGEMRLLASSENAKNEHITEAVQLALVPPMPNVNDGSWAVVRGKRAVPFVMVQAQVSEGGGPMLHFIFTPTEMLRALGGNLGQLAKLLQDKLPTYEKPSTGKLAPLTLEDVDAPSEDTQIDDILDLMTFTKNRLDVMESLLASIVQGVHVVVVNAPPRVATRNTFIAGLLALLPPSVRYAVTFATHTVPSTKLDVQIKFLTGGDGTPPPGAFVYDWETAKGSGNASADDYSRFVISQLRLDPSLVIQQTRRLTSVAAWRMRRGDKLAGALGYAAYRMRLDDSVTASQPVEAEDVAKVLSTDPTLNDDLKLSYARHLMSFSLALGELEHADPIGMMLRQDKDLADGAFEQLSNALERSDPLDIYDLLAHWLENPLGPEGDKWLDLTHRAAMMHMRELVEDAETREAGLFLKRVSDAGAVVAAGRMIPRLIEIVLPLTAKSEQLARLAFVTAATYLPTKQFQRLLSADKFVAQLPKAVDAFVQHLRNPNNKPRPGLTMSVASAFGREHGPLVLMRLAEVAVDLNRMALIDVKALGGLTRVASTTIGAEHDHALRQIVHYFSDDNRITNLADPGPRHLLEILLVLGHYRDLAKQMINQSRLLYPPDDQLAYAQMVQKLFADAKLDVEAIPKAIQELRGEGIRSLPLVLTCVGSLQGRAACVELDEIAQEATEMLHANPGIASVLPLGSLAVLIDYLAKQRNIPNTIRACGLLPGVAAREGERAASTLAKLYQQLDYDEALRLARMEILRRYVRQCETSASRKAVGLLGRALGDDVQTALEATYAIKLMMGDSDGDLVGYAQHIETVAELLHDIAIAYEGGRGSTPNIGSLMNDLESAPGGLTRQQRLNIARDTVQGGRAAYQLGTQHVALRGYNDDRRIADLLNGSHDPESALEIMRVIAGYVAQSKRFRVSFESQAHTLHPLRERSSTDLSRIFGYMHDLLRGTLAALPPDTKTSLSAQALRDEMESLWTTIKLADQRKIVEGLARNFQVIIDVTTLIAREGDPKALGDSGIGRKLEQNKARPRNTLEFLRFVSGYFKQLAERG